MKTLLLFLKDHWPILTTVTTITFFGLCWFYTQAYYAFFDIDFFHFAPFTDIYRLPLSTPGLFLVFMLSSAVITVIFAAGFRHILIGAEAQGNHAYFARPFIASLKLAGLTVVVLAYGSIIVGFPKKQATAPLSGDTARFNFRVQKSTEMKCVSIIGGTSEYIFVKSHQLKMAVILPKSQIEIAEQVLRSPPDAPSSIKGFMPPEAQEKYLSEVKRWTQDLVAACGIESESRFSFEQ